MSMTDPIADMLTRIRNAGTARHESVSVPYSRLKEALVNLIKEAGFIKQVQVVGEGIEKSLTIELKYSAEGELIINGIERVSKPGRRIYVGYDDLRPIRNGMGVAILSTPEGIVTDVTAKSKKIGGEHLVNIW